MHPQSAGLKKESADNGKQTVKATGRNSSVTNDSPAHSAQPESRCVPMAKNEIAARILNKTNAKSVRPRTIAAMLNKCGLRDEGNGKWTIRLDPNFLSVEAISNLRMSNWPPSPLAAPPPPKK
jgi:hypothetical protein